MNAMSVLCVGQCVADLVVRPVAGLPPPGRAENVEDLRLLCGGCAANTAAVLAKLGVAVRLAARIGIDALGDAALADLRSAGVCVDAVVRDLTVRTSACVVLIAPDAQRSFWYRTGGNERLCQDDVPGALLDAAQIVHVGGAMKLEALGLAQLMTRARAAGCLTSLDTDWDTTGRWMDILGPALPHVACLLTNEEEAAMLTGLADPAAAAHSLLARGPATVVVKRGERGALVATADGVETFPAYPVDVRDTTCAGDAFCGGFLVGLCRGWPLAKTMRLANAVGALCTTKLSHHGVVTLEEALCLAQP